MVSDSYDLMELAFRSPDALAGLANHPDWRVRYATAIAMGETRDPAWLPTLATMFQHEERRSLYNQPPAHFLKCVDDTRMAEQIGPLEVSFDSSPSPETLEDWRCRGRVKQALLFAVTEIGQVDAQLLSLIQALIAREHEDYPVKAAAARALGAVGRPESRASLQLAEQIDEWCTQTEARKALKRLEDA
jgi:HEAT repeat protein